MRAQPLAAVLLLAFSAGGATAQDPRDRTTRPVLVTGRVVERDAGVPISGARIVLESMRPGDAPLESVSDPQGLFQLLRVPRGRYMLQIERLGYTSVSDTLELLDHGRVDLDVQLVPRAIELEPIIVAIRDRTAPGIRGFYERRSIGLGSYLTRADFEFGAVSQVTDAFRRVAGVTLVPRMAGGITTGQAVVLRDRCRPAVYVDGHRLAGNQGMTLDEFLHPNDIEGVEIYRGPEAPAEFAMGTNACGSLVIWTRQGGGRGTLPWWKGALVAGAAAALALLLGR